MPKALQINYNINDFIIPLHIEAKAPFNRIL